MFKNIMRGSLIPLLSSVFIFLAFFYTPSLSLHASAEEKKATVAELIEHADEFDGREITLEAEVIGDIMERGSYTWINILDETTSIGVWISTNNVNQIGITGRYKQKGDLIKVTGVFHDACLEHDGEADIHCIEIQVLQPGYKIKDSLSLNKLIITASLMIAAGLLGYLYHHLYRGIRYYNED